MTKSRLLNEPGPDTPKAETGILGGGFNLLEWVSGRDRATRMVRIYGSLGLFAEREQAGFDLEYARAAGDEKQASTLLEKIGDLTQRMQDDYVDFKLQALTESRRQELFQELLDAGLQEEPEELTTNMLAHYVVEPEGVTAEGLREMAEWDQAQTAKLVAAMNELNSSTPSIEGSRPF